MLIEIQDTLKGDGTPRGPVRPMKRAVNISMAIMTVFYYAISLTGYGTWGNDSSNRFGKVLPDDVLTGELWLMVCWRVEVGSKSRAVTHLDFSHTHRLPRPQVGHPAVQHPGHAAHDPGVPGE